MNLVVAVEIGDPEETPTSSSPAAAQNGGGKASKPRRQRTHFTSQQVRRKTLSLKDE